MVSVIGKNFLNMIKRIFRKLKYFILDNVIGVSVVILTIILLMLFPALPKAFGIDKPIRSISLYSEQANYNKEEAGSWKIEKSAKWVDKGVAEVTVDVDTIANIKSDYQDVLFVLDVSESMNGYRLERVKSAVTNLVDDLLSNEQNRAGLITFSDTSKIVSSFTNNKDELLNKINGLRTTGSTNFYQALVNVDSLLKRYRKENDRECVVLFLTDGYANEDTPNELSQYKYLKKQYPFIKINGIQYEMGENILHFLDKITDKQYVANMDNLDVILKEASVVTKSYDDFLISEFINSDNFVVESEQDIKVDKGMIKLNSEQQKIDWSISNFVTGTKAEMTIKIKLKNKNEVGEYSVNSKEIVTSSFGAIKDEVVCLETPVLKDRYKVIYDGNEPLMCHIEVPSSGTFSVFDLVEISDDVPKCNGYKFKGWEFATRGIKIVNDDFFIMPEKDVYIRAVWSKTNLNTSMNGKIQEKLTLYKQVQQDANDSSKHAKKYTGPTNTFTGNEEIYYYERGAVNNNVIFGEYCWNVIRTTDTGGVKLLYSGLPTADGRCANVPETAYLTKEQMNTDSVQVSFNSYGSPSHFGYMYNASYDMEERNAIRKTTTVLKKYITKPTTAFYYADSYTWDGTNYKMENEEKLVWEENYQNLVGKYTYGKSTAATGNKTLLYILRADEDAMYYMTLSNGKGISEDRNETKLILSKSITTNSSGNYLLTEPVAVNKIDWYDNSEKYSGYYLCDGHSTECNANMLKEILTTTNTSFTFYFVKKYGNSFTYKNGQYQLVNTVDTARLWDDDSLANNHYTCFNSSGICSTLSYVYNGDEEKLYYINLTEGKGVEDALYEMFRSPDVNKNESEVKKAIDYWYQNNMTQYTDYLEDTVWCNDRELRSDSKMISGWNPNGGKLNENLFFRVTEDAHDLTCPNELDRFTVSIENGNGKLKYPVALLSKKENNLVEQGSGDMPYIWGESFSLMSPAFVAGRGLAFYISNSKKGYEPSDGADVVVRPSISLRSGIEFSSGDGSYDRPYVIDLSALKHKIYISDLDIEANKDSALNDEEIILSSKQSGYRVTAFKLNGKLISGNIFKMPESAALITDVVVSQEGV